MSPSKVTATESTADREIVMTRVFDAPRELVFSAWTDARHVPHWWGPRGFTTTVREMDVKPGGSWRFVMHGPDGTDYPNLIVYSEVVRPERLVYTHGSGVDDDTLPFDVTVTFVEEQGKTKVTMRLLLASPAEREKLVKFGAVEGGNQTLDRLAEYLPTMEPEFVLTRVFNAPLELVWKAWTEAERLKHWWGPKGFTMRTCTMDFRPGGKFHYCLVDPNGDEMWGRFAYKKIVPRERIVYINSFSDAAGGVARHHQHEAWPLELWSTLTFAERDGKTTVTIRWAPYSATALERRTFVAGMGSMQYGWTGTLDQLAAYLARA